MRAREGLNPFKATGLEADHRSRSSVKLEASPAAAVHSAPVRIYDRRGRWVSTLHAGVESTATNLVHDLRQASQA
jgi:copper oxidase (laccase) domain-containing protein